MKKLAVASLLFLCACVIRPLAEKPACPAAVASPKPVWPDSCVADWYAAASLPPCVEDYLQSVKTQQKKIAKKVEK
jgi:hypothetical protein